MYRGRRVCTSIGCSGLCNGVPHSLPAHPSLFRYILTQCVYMLSYCSIMITKLAFGGHTRLRSCPLAKIIPPVYSGLPGPKAIPKLDTPMHLTAPTCIQSSWYFWVMKTDSLGGAYDGYFLFTGIDLITKIKLLIIPIVSSILSGLINSFSCFGRYYFVIFSS